MTMVLSFTVHARDRDNVMHLINNNRDLINGKGKEGEEARAFTRGGDHGIRGREGHWQRGSARPRGG